jgi:Sulfotransferase family
VRGLVTTPGAPLSPAPLILRPVFLVGAPRSGTTALFQALASHPDLWTLYGEGDAVISVPLRRWATQSWFVPGAVVDDALASTIRRRYFDRVANVERTALGAAASRLIPLRSRDRLSRVLQRVGRRSKHPPLRVLDKTPGNSFRIQPLRRVFPDIRFIFLCRDPRGAIGSMRHAWRDERRFQGTDFPPDFGLYDYEGRWCFGVPPGWEGLNGKSLMEMCAFQWASYNEHCLRDLPKDPVSCLRVRYEELQREPGRLFGRIAEWADIDPSPFARYDSKIPVMNTSTAPKDDKWRRYEPEMAAVRERILAVSQALGFSL